MEKDKREWKSSGVVFDELREWSGIWLQNETGNQNSEVRVVYEVRERSGAEYSEVWAVDEMRGGSGA